MVTTTSEREPHLDQGGASVAAESVRLTVTGLDENGQMFREAAPILRLEGRDCSFRSKFQPAAGSWILIEIDLPKQGSKRSTVQGQVRSVSPEGVATNLFQVRVELESAQGVKVAAKPQKELVATQELPPAAVALVTAESSSTAASAPTVAAEAQIQPADASLPATPVKANPVPVAAQAPTKIEFPAPANIEPPAQSAALGREEVKPDIASEIKQQLAALKNLLNQELEQTVRQTIEKQISVSYESAIQTLNSDLAYQLVGRLANSDDVKTLIQKLARESLAEQVASSRNSMSDAQQKFNSQVTQLTQSFGKSIAEIELKLNGAQESARAVLDRARTLNESLESEQNQSVQKAVDQMKQAATSMTEKFDGHITGQLNSWSLQFKKHLDEVSKEKLVQLVTDQQEQLALLRQDANEILEKLAAGLQLSQGTFRMHEEQLAGFSRSAIVEFEKEIKALMLRLAGTV